MRAQRRGSRWTGYPRDHTVYTDAVFRPGTDGTYSVDIRYLNETDGNSLAELYVGGRLVGSWDFSADTNALATKMFTGVSIKNRDVIKVISYAIAGEYARIDYITVR